MNFEDGNESAGDIVGTVGDPYPNEDYESQGIYSQGEYGFGLPEDGFELPDNGAENDCILEDENDAFQSQDKSILFNSNTSRPSESQGIYSQREYGFGLSEDDFEDGAENDSTLEAEDDAFQTQGKRKRGRPKKDIGKAETSQNKRAKRTLPVSVLISTICCVQLCLASIQEEIIAAARDNFSVMSMFEKHQWLLDYFWSHSRFQSNEGIWEYVYILGTSAVCSLAFRLALGVPSSTFYDIRNKFLNGEKVIQHKKSRLGRRSNASMAALSWLQDHASKFAEKLPNSHQLHFPSCQTKTSIYEELKVELAGEDCVSFSHFLKLWREEMKHVAIPKTSRFSKCNICTQIKIELGKTRDEKKRKLLMERRERHLKKQNAERLKYYKHQMKARNKPEEYLSIIIDGMDQSKTMIPHFQYTSKYTSSMWKLKVHVVGVIVHGIGIYGFFDLFEWSHSSNLTITILLDVLFMMKDSLPDTLYLQMDNCYRENKNRYMLAFLSLLVERKIFKKVKISFLMVGHTHEDVDQVFSRFSNWLNKHAATTLPKLMEAFEKAYKPPPTSIRTARLFDVSSWVEPFTDTIKNHSKPHSFKICLDASNRAKLLWKKWATDKTWNEVDGYLLKTQAASIKTEPDVLVPDYTGVLSDKLETDIKNSFKFFTSEADKLWWTKFLKKEGEDVLTNTQYVWPVETLTQAKINREIATPKEDSCNLQLEFEDEDAEIPPVIIGNRKPEAESSQGTLKEGDLCLLDCSRYPNEWPQMGRIVSLSETEVCVHWYKGCKTGSWKTCNVRSGSKFVPFTEVVPISSVWLSGFSLTPGHVLPNKIKKKLDSYTNDTATTSSLN